MEDQVSFSFASVEGWGVLVVVGFRAVVVVVVKNADGFFLLLLRKNVFEKNVEHRSYHSHINNILIHLHAVMEEFIRVELHFAGDDEEANDSFGEIFGREKSVYQPGAEGDFGEQEKCAMVVLLADCEGGVDDEEPECGKGPK